ncbi:MULTISPECIES: mechanosensitive ion channel family protein [unclassified Haladaptatus]|uniref:mechanosensitive ion channel family protein n=1 Tax=unclassified Haladaptatus TaxID=2622732 RepID=UPI0023E76A85|nr:MULTISPECIES: mechanosensitive ion channel family protein [unclassified Haladaptatus]
MSFHAEFLAWLESLFLTPESQIVGTVVVAVGLAIALLGLNASGAVLKDYINSWLVEVSQIAIGGALITGAVLLLVVIWGAASQVLSALSFLALTPAQVVLVLFTFVLFMTAVALMRAVKHTVDRFVEKHDEVTDHQRQMTNRIAQVTIFALASLIALNLWGVDLGNLLLGAGFLGLVLGLAARQTLGSALAGFVLLFSRPFEVRDWVEIGENEGIVTDITLVNTRIRTFDDEYLIIPNDQVTGDEIVNKSRRGRLRVTVDVGVDYETDVDRAVEVAGQAMNGLDEIRSVPSSHAVLKEFGDSAVVLELRFWIDDPTARKKWKAQTAVISAVKTTFDEDGIKIPFPQRELTGRPESEGLRVRGEQRAASARQESQAGVAANSSGESADDHEATDDDGDGNEEDDDDKTVADIIEETTEDDESSEGGEPPEDEASTETEKQAADGEATE